MPFYDCENRVSYSLFSFNSNNTDKQINFVRLRLNMQKASDQLFNDQQQKQKDDYEPRINLQGK